MTYKDQFTPYLEGLDLTFDGVGKSNEQRKKHLYPYQIVNLIDGALSANAMNDRIKIIESVIAKCLKISRTNV